MNDVEAYVSLPDASKDSSIIPSFIISKFTGRPSKYTILNYDIGSDTTYDIKRTFILDDKQSESVASKIIESIN